MTYKYVVANQKGGVGKTTSVVNIASVMADWGFKVLIVDIDPQANSSTSLGIDARELEISLYDVLVGAHTIHDAILHTRWPGLDILPSTPSLAGATVELNRMPARERAERLKVAFEALGDGYHYVFIDSPPSLGVLTVNALTASDAALVPVQCEYLALEGLSQLMHTITLVQRGLNPGLELRGVMMTMYDRRTTLARQVVQEVRRYFPGKVFNTTIPRSVRLSEAPSYGEPGVLYSPKSSGAAAYRLLTRELLKGDGFPVQ